ncbi:centrin, putative [Trichomonas vaginalis G3]|uniref:Centrin, putative n=1 Tax=Trichomonas vaginalis (strain ATCC PRA-98 / G3) TaxID=412133 RepID=A2DNC2_TRIV3|nr:calcium ion binding [Trichomonas vaginalis G3]EAY18110.1 centrin, putative [Trichomonas vaginalis G3]KAI5492387.1 calcium ion binding [Trichomonas vaginalis G3]|eukprot:XP_001579096.1 centrin [Trichomonas vaginalis G3]
MSARKPAARTSARRQGRPRVELTEDQRLEIKEAFDIFDSDKSGSIDKHELRVAMRAMGFDVSKNEILEIMENKDPDNTGSINFQAFQEVVGDKMAQRDPIEEIRKAFALFDDDHTGKISIKNLRRVARELGEAMTDDELQAMIDEFDTDKDGYISEAEFIAIMDPTQSV